MKKIILAAVLVVIIILSVSFLWASFDTYESIRWRHPFIDDNLNSGNILDAGVYYASEKEKITVFVFVRGDSIFTTNEFENYARLNSFDNELDAVEYSRILDSGTKINISFLGKIEQGHTQQYISVDDPTYFKVEIYCGFEKEFIPELELFQKDCEMNFTEVDKATYVRNKTNGRNILLKPKEIEIYDAFNSVNIQSEEFAKISFFGYLSNPAAYVRRDNELQLLLNDKISEVLESRIITNPREELDEIIYYLDDKNMDIIVLSGKFELEKELSLDSNYVITLDESLPERIELIGQNRLINTGAFPSNLKFVVKKENGVIEILVDRA